MTKKSNIKIIYHVDHSQMGHPVGLHSCGLEDLQHLPMHYCNDFEW